MIAVNYALPLGVPGNPYARTVAVVFAVAVVLWLRARPSAGDLRGWTPYQTSLVAVLTVLTIWGCMSLVWSQVPLTSVATILNLTVSLAAAVGFTLLLRRRPGLLIEYCRGWLVAVYLIGIVAVGERLAGFQVPVERLPGIDDALESGTGTLTTFFVNPNEMAVFLVLSLPAALALSRNPHRSERLLARLAVIIILVGTLAASARLSSVLVVLTLVAFIVLDRNWAVATKGILLGGAAVFVVAVGLALPELLEKMSNLSESLSGSHTNSRTQLAADGFDLLMSSGGLGVGAGAFESNATNPRLTYLGLWAFNPHNVYVEALAEFGLVAGGVFICWIFWLGWRWYSDRSTPNRPIVLSCWICLAGVGAQSSASLNSLAFFMLPLTLVTLASQAQQSVEGGAPQRRNLAKKGATTMDDFTRQVRTSWVLILIGTVAGAALGFAYSLVRSPAYISESQVRISWQPADDRPMAEGYDPLLARTTAYAAQAGSASVLAPTLERLGIEESVDALVKSKKFAAAPAGSGLVVITAEAATREKAETLTRDAAEGLKAIVDADTFYNGKPRATVVGPTATPARAPMPLSLLVIAGALTGALLVSLVVALRAGLRPRVMSLAGLRNVVGDRAIVLGSIGEGPASRRDNTAAGIALDRLRPAAQGGVAAVVQNQPGTTAALALAEALRETGRSVAVLDADSIPAAQTSVVGAPGSDRALARTVGSLPRSDLRERIEADRAANDWVLLALAAEQNDRVAAAVNYVADIAVITVTAGRTTISEVDDLLAEVPPDVQAAVVLLKP